MKGTERGKYVYSLSGSRKITVLNTIVEPTPLTPCPAMYPMDVQTSHFCLTKYINVRLQFLNSLDPACLNKTHTEEISKNGGHSHSLLWLWIVIAVLAVIVLSAIIFYFVWRRKQRDPCGKNDPESQSFLTNIDSDKLFYNTSAYHQAVQFIKDGGRFLFLIGQWGSGKTTVAKRVYTSVTGKTPVLAKDLLGFDIHEQEKPVIFDEAISRNLSYEEKQALKTNINSCCERKSSVPEEFLFIIFTFTDTNEYKECIKLLPHDEKLKIINLHDSLTKGDRSQILHAHFKYFCPDQAFNEIEKIAIKNSTKSLGYPEMCFLFCRSKQLREQTGPLIFFNRPLLNLSLYLQKMHHTEDRDKFLLLVYMCLNEMNKDIKASNNELLVFLESHEPCECLKIKDEENPNQLKLIRTKEADNGMEKTCESHLVAGDTSDKFVDSLSQTMSLEAEIAEDTVENKSPKPSNANPKQLDRDYDRIRSLISWEFVVKVPESPYKYRLQHDIIKRITLIVYGTCYFDKLLEYAKLANLEGWIEKESLVEALRSKLNDIKPVLKVNSEKWETYKQKCKPSISR
uniref:Uncharacterized protein LOC111121524 isoform X2 n=1 Tax=Crassostrea virginica TaxID=6565 RepID=A0A8B8CVR2_CRAVI|nr:uncharacterized protein LOC111121524 isoform X2 [Crassostrea virginica]